MVAASLQEDGEPDLTTIHEISMTSLTSHYIVLKSDGGNMEAMSRGSVDGLLMDTCFPSHDLIH